MIKKVSDFLRDKENHQFVADLVKSFGWMMLLFNRSAAEAWAEAKIRLIRQNGTINKFLDGVGDFLKVGAVQIVLALALQLACWIVIVGALTILKADKQTAAVLIAVASLMIALLVEGGLLLQAVKAHGAAELSIAAVKLMRGGVNKAARLLPTQLQFNWGAATEETLSGVRGVAMIPYKAMFWLGMVNIALTIIVCLNFKVYYGAILAASLLNFALAGLGLKVGYQLTSNAARDWSFRFALLALFLGLVAVAIGPQKIAEWSSSKSIAAMKTDVLYNQRKAELVEANKLLASTNGKMTPEQKIDYDWLMNDDPKKGPRPTPAGPAVPTCSDGKDNNNDGAIDENDRSCGTLDKSCITGYEVSYVKGEDGKPVIDENGKKKVASRKPRLADGCRQFEDDDLPRRYDARLNERDLPKSDKKQEHSGNASNGSGNGNAGNHHAAAAPSPPPQAQPNGSTPFGRAALKVAGKYGIAYQH